MACSVTRTVVSLSGGLASADASFLHPAGKASVARMFTRRRNYSLSASADKNLLDAIQLEIDCKSTNNHLLEALVAETPKDFPFKIEEMRRDYLTFVGEHNGETIEVEVAEKKWWERRNSDYLTFVGESKLIEVIVFLHKKNRALLKFQCTASPPDGFTVDVISMEFPEEDFDMYFNCYSISKFNEKMQKGLIEYLEKRGINLTTANLFCNYLDTYLMTTKQEDRDAVSWLKAFKEYVLPTSSPILL